MTKDSSPSSGSEPAPWWANVSTKELAASSELVTGLLNPARHPAGSTPTSFARALVIQQLFEQETLLRDLLAEANERCRVYDRVDTTADLTEPNEWLKHCAFLGDVFGQSIEMLGSEGHRARKAPLDEFVMRVTVLRRHLIDVEMSMGIGRDVAAPPPVSFRRRDSL